MSEDEEMAALLAAYLSDVTGEPVNYLDVLDCLASAGLALKNVNPSHSSAAYYAAIENQI